MFFPSLHKPIHVGTADTKATEIVVVKNLFIQDVETGLFSDASKVTIKGLGFDASYSSKNVITLAQSTGTIRALGPDSLNTPTTRTTLLLSFTHLIPEHEDIFLRTAVSIHNTWSTVQGNNQVEGGQNLFWEKISKIVAVAPTVEDDGEHLRSDSATFTIKGRGFDSKNSERNVITLASPIKATFDSTSKTTHTSLIVAFTHLSPVHDGQDMKASVEVFSGFVSSEGKVTKILGVNPTVVDDGEVLSSDSSKFTIMGKGFDASNANLHTFSLSGNVKALLGSSAKSTHTSLEISFTHLSPLDAGNLNAAVTVDTTWSSSGTFQF